MQTCQTQSILVTGGAGFVGTHLSRKLINLGYLVRVLDLRKPTTVVEGVEYIQGDVRDQKLLHELVGGVSTVYHLAATVSVPLCQKDPLESYSNNFTATLTVLEAIRKHSSKSPAPIRLVFASTAALYGSMGDDGRALTENDTAAEFFSFYAAQKHACERAIELYKSAFGIPSMVYRFFNIFGPGQDPTSPYSGVITIFSKFAREGKPLPLNAGGIQTRDFISVYDIANACAAALSVKTENWDARPINLGTGSSITVRQLAEMIRELSGGKSELINAPAREGDVVHSLANIQRARDIIKFKTEHDLKTGLIQLVRE
ncbi:MAG: NAD-dependent epimerase/dehydratase family protein [Deltaproteobacteria bacterium]|nr:NAD-dependent epimerase/dehydratase family protein [Deltaproteobacteria bacterium]